jgi:hypothetical protein
MMRDATFDLSLGLGQIRWRDTPSDVLREYPHAKAALSLHGRDHVSGESIYIEPGYVIEDFTRLPSIALSACIGFHESRVVGIDMSTRRGYHAHQVPAYMRAELQRFCDLLGINIEIPGPALQVWEKDGARIEIHRPSTDFVVSIYGPGTEALGRDNPAHRAYRLAQAQRCLQASKA